ncbi:MAG: MTAP family purine nucleoside phosphorylase, partial [Bdellovibrionota bacterium]
MIGVIGGSGLYSLEGLQILESKEVYTPFGAPSAPLVRGKFGATEVVFLPRHGQHHTITPSEINYRANIWALKSVGVTQILSVSAVGSLSKDIPPGDLAMPDQYFDFTKGKRAASFFGDGVVG